MRGDRGFFDKIKKDLKYHEITPFICCDISKTKEDYVSFKMFTVESILYLLELSKHIKQITISRTSDPDTNDIDDSVWLYPPLKYEKFHEGERDLIGVLRSL